MTKLPTATSNISPAQGNRTGMYRKPDSKNIKPIFSRLKIISSKYFPNRGLMPAATGRNCSRLPSMALPNTPIVNACTTASVSNEIQIDANPLTGLMPLPPDPKRATFANTVLALYWQAHAQSIESTLSRQIFMTASPAASTLPSM